MYPEVAAGGAAIVRFWDGFHSAHFSRVYISDYSQDLSQSLILRSAHKWPGPGGRLWSENRSQSDPFHSRRWCGVFQAANTEIKRRGSACVFLYTPPDPALKLSEDAKFTFLLCLLLSWFINMRSFFVSSGGYLKLPMIYHVSSHRKTSIWLWRLLLND